MIDGEKSLFECREIRDRCALFGGKPAVWTARGVCTIHAIMLGADARMRETLAAHRLPDIAANVAAEMGPGFGQEAAKWLAGGAPTSGRTQNGTTKN